MLSKQAIPDSIAGLQKLVELDISNNLLRSLPDSVGLLPNLKNLNLSGNKLTALPESIALCRYFFLFILRIKFFVDLILIFAAYLFLLFSASVKFWFYAIAGH